MMRYLATNGIAVTAEPDEAAATYRLNLTMNIADAGFNRDTLLHAVETLSACVLRLREAILCG